MFRERQHERPTPLGALPTANGAGRGLPDESGHEGLVAGHAFSGGMIGYLDSSLINDVFSSEFESSGLVANYLHPASGSGA